MLEKTRTEQIHTFLENLENYLRKILPDQVKVKGFNNTESLPSFLVYSYEFYQCRIAGNSCLFLITLDNFATPSEIVKHVNLMRNLDSHIVIFATPSMSSYYRNRLLKKRISFVVPENQLYIPELAIDLRDFFHAKRNRSVNTLSPIAQAMLFRHILNPNTKKQIQSSISEQLNVSSMSIKRAKDELVNFGLAKDYRIGKGKYIEYQKNSRKLFKDALVHLIRPVRQKFHIICQGKITFPSKVAGESALSKFTELSKPKLRTIAVSSKKWKNIVSNHKIFVVDQYDAEMIVETWIYEPSLLSNRSVVDPLSLYVQYHDHADERIALAAEQLLEDVNW